MNSLPFEILNEILSFSKEIKPFLCVSKYINALFAENLNIFGDVNIRYVIDDSEKNIIFLNNSITEIIISGNITLKIINFIGKCKNARIIRFNMNLISDIFEFFPKIDNVNISTDNFSFTVNTMRDSLLWFATKNLDDFYKAPKYKYEKITCAYMIRMSNYFIKSHEASKIFENYTNITNINLSYPGINYKILLTLKNLARLNISLCGNTDFSCLSQLSKLKEINLSFCYEITDEHLWNLPYITKLTIDNCELISGSCFEFMPNITELEIIRCKKINYEYLISLKHLTKLSVTSCNKYQCFVLDDICISCSKSRMKIFNKYIKKLRSLELLALSIGCERYDKTININPFFLK